MRFLTKLCHPQYSRFVRQRSGPLPCHAYLTTTTPKTEISVHQQRRQSHPDIPERYLSNRFTTPRPLGLVSPPDQESILVCRHHRHVTLRSFKSTTTYILQYQGKSDVAFVRHHSSLHGRSLLSLGVTTSPQLSHIQTQVLGESS